MVQEQEEVLLAQVPFKQVEQWMISGFFEVKRLGNSRYNEIGITERSQIHEIHPIGEQVAEFCRHLQTQARFPCAARSCQGHQSHVFALKEVLNGCSFLLPTNEWRQLDRQVVAAAVQGLEGSKIGAPGL